MEGCSMALNVDVATPGKKRDHSSLEASSKGTEDSRKIQELEATVDAITKVSEWRIEQLKLLEVEKRAAEKSLDEERKLFSEMSLEMSRQSTAQIQALQEHWSSLMNNRNTVNGNILGVQSSFIASAAASTSKLERALDGMRVQLSLRSDERDKWKTKSKTLEQEVYGAKQQIMKLTAELHTSKAKAVMLAKAQSIGSDLEEVCRDLLEQLERRNVELERCRAQSSDGKIAQLQQLVNERDEEILGMQRILNDQLAQNAEATECIICMDEFGAEPDRQRAHWKDCNHANVCYKCTETLWSSKKRRCPSCNTPASSIPGRLPPNIFL